MVSAEAFRTVVSSLPEATERETWGHPTFRVRDKMLATLSDDGRSATLTATREEQAALVAAPATFDVPAYVGRHGWVGIQLATVDPTELRELLVEAWRQTALKRLVSADDAHQPGPGQVGTEATHRPVLVTRGRGSMRPWPLDLVRFR